MDEQHDRERMLKNWTSKGADRKNGWELPGKKDKEWKGSWEATFEAYEGEKRGKKAELEELLKKKLKIV